MSPKPVRPSKPRAATPKRSGAGEREVRRESAAQRTKVAESSGAGERRRRASDGSQTDPAVDAFIAKLDAPRKQEVEAVRRIILGAGSEIREEIKWNAPSFRTTEHFATLNLRSRSGLRLILHLGVEVKATAKTGIEIPDPEGLLEWLARDRCLVTFVDAADIEAKRAALRAIVRAWLRWL